MTDTNPPASLRHPAARDQLRHGLIRWTALFWAIAYAFLTIRSVVGGHGHLGLQALIRIPMIALGIGICALLYLLLIRIDESPPHFKIALALVAVLLGSLLFSFFAYLAFYVWPGVWQSERSPVRSVFAYVIQFAWIFGAWVLLFQYLRHHALVAARAAAEPRFASELWAHQRGRQVRIPVGEIDWIESEGDYARVHVADNSFLIRSTMRKMEDSLDPTELIRVHRRAIVARKKIETITRGPDGRLSIQLRSGAIIPVGRRYAHMLRAHVVV